MGGGRSSRQNSGRNFSIGDLVEVSSDEEGFRGAWYEATILKSLSSSRSCYSKRKAEALVQYRNLLSDTDEKKPLTEYVDFSFIRPLPPVPSTIPAFEPLDVVDAFHRDGWWKGIVTKVDVFEDDKTNSKKYTVVFENPPEQFQFLFLIQVINQKKESSVIGQQKEGEQSNLAGNGTSEIDFQDCATEEAELSTVISMEHLDVLTGSSAIVSLENHMAKEVSMAAVMESCNTQALSTCFPDVLTGSSAIVSLENHMAKEVSMAAVMESCNTQALSTCFPDVLTGSSAIVSLENHMAKEVSMAAVMESCNTQALSTCFPGKRERKVENFKQSSVINVPEATELVENLEMPFLKSSLIWKNIESLEVFQVLPQKPHFSPLIGHKEASREGMAMGHMLSFAVLIEKMSKLRVDDGREVFESYMEVLAELEMHGFEVKAIAERLEKLLSIKDRCKRLEDEAKKVHIGMAEGKNEKIKLEEDIDKIEKRIRQLEEQRAMKVSMKMMKDSELITLQVNANAVNEDILNMEHEFENVAAAPW
eukprot:XP_025012514.1 DUF724 domain-containing protein 1-like [Ricinus communis]